MHRGFTLLLGVLVLVQLAVVGINLSARGEVMAPALPSFASSAPLAEITGRSGDHNRSVKLVREDKRWTVVLAFKSDCYYCGEVAPAWREWLRANDQFEVIALSRDSFSVAEQYLRAHELGVEVLSVAENHGASPERYIVSRTPWIFLFDATGTLRFEGNGQNINDLQSFHKMPAPSESGFSKGV